MTDPHVPEGIRLQKVLANAGVGSRRACEQLISQGRVTVNGTVVRELGTRIDPAGAVIHVDDARVFLDDTHLTLALNKPVGVVSSMADEFDRPEDRKSTRLNSSHVATSYAVSCLNKKIELQNSVTPFLPYH